MTRAEGARAFGENPNAYGRCRPDYPARAWDHIRDACGIGPGSAGFEIGPGTGKATRALLDLGIATLLGIEADPRLAAFLAAGYPSGKSRSGMPNLPNLPKPRLAENRRNIAAETAAAG